MALPKALKDAANALRKLPQIGPRQATRLAFFLFKEPEMRAEIIRALSAFETTMTLCKSCFRVSEESPCSICKDKNRDKSMLAVVEEDSDLEQIEKTGVFNGIYFVLGGRFNPNRGDLQSQNLRLKELKSAIEKQKPTLKEIILASNPTPEGDMLVMLLSKELKNENIKISRLGRGIPSGGEIEYADEETLKGAFQHRD